MLHHLCTSSAGGLIDACTQAASGVLSPAQARAVLNQQLEYVIGILLVGGIASGLRAYMFNAAAERVMCRLRVQLFSKVRFPCTIRFLLCMGMHVCLALLLHTLHCACCNAASLVFNAVHVNSSCIACHGIFNSGAQHAMSH